MPKNKSIFVCQECGYESNGWLGKCPSCNSWNTFTEEIQDSSMDLKKKNVFFDVKPVNINDIEVENEER